MSESSPCHTCYLCGWLVLADVKFPIFTGCLGWAGVEARIGRVSSEVTRQEGLFELYVDKASNFQSLKLEHLLIQVKLSLSSWLTELEQVFKTAMKSSGKL